MPAEIDWSLFKPPGDQVTTALNAYETGRALAQKYGVQKALADAASSPGGISSAVGPILAYGDIPDAATVSNIGYQQVQRQNLQTGYGMVFGGSPVGAGGATQAPVVQPPQPQPAQPTAQPAAEPQQPQPSPQHFASIPPEGLAKVNGYLDTLDRLGVELSSLPYDQRAARLAQEKPALVAAGVPQNVLDGFDPTDANIAQAHEGVAETRRMLPGGAASAQDPQQGAPQAVAPTAAPPAAPQAPMPPQAAPQAPMASPAPQPAATQPAQGHGLNLQDPNVQRGLMLIQAGGGDIGPIVALGTAAMPKYSATRSGLIFNEHTGQFERSGPNEQGIEYEIGPTGNVIGSHNVPGYVDASAVQAATKAAAEASGKLPFVGPAARAQAAGEHAGAAPYEVHEIPNGDGSTTSGILRVINGKTVFVPLQPGPGAQAGAAAPGLPAPAFGRSQPTAEKAFSAEDATNFGKTVEQAGPEQQMAVQSHIVTAQQAVHAAQSINPNAWTPQVKAVADTLNALGLDSKQANDLNYYASIIPQVTRASFSTFPRLEKEFQLVKAAIPGLTTPRDAASLTFATIAAVNERNLAFLKFTNDYQGAHSEAALNKAWQASPQGSASIFADPIFRGLTMDGKPAVYINPTPHNGHTYGVFRPGTKDAQTFLVQ